MVAEFERAGHALRPFFGRGWFFEPTTRTFDNKSQSFAMGIAAVLLDRNHTKLFGNQAVGRFKLLYL
jgi:hypothetical protein